MRLPSLVAQACDPVLNTKDWGIKVVWKMVSADTNGVIQCGCYGVSVVLLEHCGTFTLAYIPHWSDFHLLFFIFFTYLNTLRINMIWAFDYLNIFM